MAVGRHRNSKVSPERLSLILGAVDAARLQDRDDGLDEDFEFFRQRHVDDEPVRATFFQPALERVGDLFRCADELCPWRRKVQRHLAGFCRKLFEKVICCMTLALFSGSLSCSKAAILIDP